MCRTSRTSGGSGGSWSPVADEQRIRGTRRACEACQHHACRTLRPYAPNARRMHRLQAAEWDGTAALAALLTRSYGKLCYKRGVSRWPCQANETSQPTRSKTNERDTNPLDHNNNHRVVLHRTKYAIRSGSAGRRDGNKQKRRRRRRNSPSPLLSSPILPTSKYPKAPAPLAWTTRSGIRSRSKCARWSIRV